MTKQSFHLLLLATIIIMTTATTRALLLSSRATTTAARRNLVSQTWPSVSMNEISLSLNDGMVLAGQRWTYNDNSTTTNPQQQQPKHKILALHGWLDNCRSFHLLAPSLVTKLQGSAEIIALDLPGHGWSSHKSLDGPPTVLTEGVYYIAEALDKLGWTRNDNGNDEDEGVKTEKDNHKVSLIGHSMGGGLSLAYAGVFPENVDKLVMLDIYVSTQKQAR